MVFEQYIANQYLRALAVLLVVFLVLKIIIFIIERVILRVTKKTKTDIDDLIVEKISKPFTFLVFVIGIYFATLEIAFSEASALVVKNIVYSLVVISISYMTYAFVDIVIIRVFKKIVGKTKTDLDDSLISLVSSVLKVAWIVITLLYVLDVWGVEIGPFLAGLGIGGLAIAFAMQESLSNIFGGVSIILDKTVKVGDLIYLDQETRGEILKIGLRATKIKTFDNEIIVIPNSKLAQSTVQNVAQPEPKSRVVVPFGVAYGSDIEKVKKVVMKEIMQIKNRSKDPEPVIRFLEMADSSLNFKAYFHVDSFKNRIGAVDEANTRIYNALNKAGIEIPFPQMDVNLKK